MERKLISGVYRHFKGGLYVLDDGFLGEHTETGEKLVVYRSLSNGTTYVRPYDMFISEVDKEKYPEAEQKYRLELVSPKY